MTDLISYAAELEDLAGAGRLPPVEQWRPERTGVVDIVIQSDGVWRHEGALIRNAKLVRLFSTILRKDGDDFYLVTPAERLKITVEDAPFVAVAMSVKDDRLIFRTNLGDRVTAGDDHALFMRQRDGAVTPAPYIHVRNGLDARLGRPVYFELAERVEHRTVAGEPVLGVASGAAFFPLEPLAASTPQIQ